MFFNKKAKQQSSTPSLIHSFDPMLDLRVSENKVPYENREERFATRNELHKHLTGHFLVPMMDGSREGRSALKHYTGPGYRSMNKLIHAGSTSDDIEHLKGFLKHTAEQHPLDVPMITYTGMMSAQPGHDHGDGSTGIFPKIQALAPGQKTAIAGFNSSSIDFGVAKLFSAERVGMGDAKEPPSKRHLHYAVFHHPVGSTAGVYAEPLSCNRGEYEHLIRPGAEFTFDKTTHHETTSKVGGFISYHPMNNIWHPERGDSSYEAQRDAEPIDLTTVHHFHHFNGAAK